MQPVEHVEAQSLDLRAHWQDCGADQTIKPQVLAEEIDLSYVILAWSSKLRNGKKGLQQNFGARIGFRC